MRPKELMSSLGKLTRVGQQANKYEARFNNGDYLIAAQWYERLCESGDGERLGF
jgi:hypothetical protein